MNSDRTLIFSINDIVKETDTIKIIDFSKWNTFNLNESILALFYNSKESTDLMDILFDRGYNDCSKHYGEVLEKLDFLFQEKSLSKL